MEASTQLTEESRKAHIGTYKNNKTGSEIVIEVVNEQLTMKISTETQPETCTKQTKRYGLVRCKSTTGAEGSTDCWMTSPGHINDSPEETQAADEEQPGGNHISFFSERNMIQRLVWRSPGAENALQYTKLNTVGLLKLPDELLEHILDYALTADDEIVHIPERCGQLRIAVCRHVPYANAKFAFDDGNPTRLPEPLNNVQFVSGWTFDTFRRLDQARPASASKWFIAGTQWFDNVRKVTLLGDFGVGRTADENILHGIIRFGHQHAKADISVTVQSLSIRGYKRLDGFMTLAWLIQEAVRGTLRPTWVAPKDKLVRDKDLNFMNVANVRFKPSDVYADWQEDLKTLPVKKQKVATITRIVDECGGIDQMLVFVRGVYERGI
ncbi:hypothetical protein PtrSN002B_007026 [Pyrenophora tritici-repentis]|uniref:Uncharacterized protein n=3 Tax=Pyrenophora tritici-repentis TaxID=45151 RepID=A0A2W1FLL9_9PLEO|nr:uncharacterized protein PTRG_11914 [Pyrenophora tritici-repentis Pt-1C-BFP]KAA8617227.1 hypothetical protein PtrV1_10528 [Pyrenophora tritici-repentis]EDU46113.1 conserved hypothetical protein [Pyrenophora tritici-repentis Pt-1C-BFP]KAI0575058.1 hypothetical protein Alg215_08239 [Pyrenophora tritici-repentis]KAI0579963.1 hypothetical protein Alg130_07265 [Pyrenophora tritici-repentis]KAI0610588.1 hypothetical protein TUN205_05176 [Pyrenophora tritici-repentis]